VATRATPLVTVLLAVRDAEAYVGEAVTSVLGQTLTDLELLVVDDGSVDSTPEIVGRHAGRDRRIRVIRNDVPLGLAGSLNRGLDVARGRYVARLDADDVALPRRLETQVAALSVRAGHAVLGSGVIELRPDGPGPVHLMPSGPDAVRWAALFSAPFFHPSVLLDRDVLDRNALRYDTRFLESEDFDLWARALAVADGDNLQEPLLLYRRHSEQASERRSELQCSFQREIALRGIEAVAPELTEERGDLAWRLGAGIPLPEERIDEAADALEELAERFGKASPARGRAARRGAARALARRATRVQAPARRKLLRRSLRLWPGLPAGVALDRLRGRSARRAALAQLPPRQPTLMDHGPVRLAVVLPEPTPYRTGMLDLLAERTDVDLTVVYAGSSVQRRTWDVVLRHRALLVEGRRVPGAYRVLRHDYPLSLGVFRALRASRPEVVVLSGWSTFASQATSVWCRRNGVPYILLVESNERDARPGWRRTVKNAVVPTVVGAAAEVLVVGTLARESMLSRGVHADRISIVANTVDVRRFGREADELTSRRDALRAEAGVGVDDVAVLSVARLAREKGLDTLVRAVASAAEPRLVLLLAGSGPEREHLASLAAEVGARLVLLPDTPWERIVERYVIADVFALLSRHEPWGVVVNEAAACGLPLVLSDRVGAAFDLLDDGRNGVLVPVDDVAAAEEAIRGLAADPVRRRAMGAASRQIASDWGYEPSIERLVRVVRRVARRQAASASS
jgi:glycosyltransferase involved in cell wall biosynthesis